MYFAETRWQTPMIALLNSAQNDSTPNDVHVPIHERLSMVDGRVGVSDSGSDPPPPTPSAGHAPTRLAAMRDLHGSSGI